jgi:putative ABC transport system ATP-binding protein
MLRTALRAQRRDVGLAAVLVTVHQITEVLVPVTIGVIIDRAIAPGDAGAAVRWLLVLAGQFVVLSAAGCTAVYVDERARRAATHQARTRLAGRVLDAGGGVERALPGEIVSLSTVETNRIGDGVGAVIVGVGAVVGVLAGAAILLATSFWLGAVVVVGLPVVLVVVQAVAEPLVARADEHQEAVGEASGVAADLLRGLRVVKGLGADAAAAARYRVASREAQQAGLEANRVRSTYAGFTLSIAGAFVILVAWLGARQALDGHITVGELVAALGVTQFLIGPLGRLAYAGSELAQARASSEHLDAALHAPPAVVAGSRRLDAGAGGLPLLLSDVRHKGLQGVSFGAAAGEIVAVVCSPAEAAALVEVLDRSADPDDGTVTVGGTVHSDLTLDEARRAVTVAHHDGPLFAGSILDNVLAASPPPTGTGTSTGGPAKAASAARRLPAVGGGGTIAGPATEAAGAGGAGGAGGAAAGPAAIAAAGSVAKIGTVAVPGTGREVVADADGGPSAVAAPGLGAAGGVDDDPGDGSAARGVGESGVVAVDGAGGGSAARGVGESGVVAVGGAGGGSAAPAVGESGADGDAVVDAPGAVLAAASLDDVVAVVDGGIEGVLTDEGRSLSGGQRQRVALARALATDAPVLVLHEPTTAVDTATEHRIAGGVRSVRAGRTTLVVTASPPLLAVADRVVLIADGRVVAEGPHADLAATDDRYRQVVLR